MVKNSVKKKEGTAKEAKQTEGVKGAGSRSSTGSGGKPRFLRKVTLPGDHEEHAGCQL